jgi:hypothetical protein
MTTERFAELVERYGIIYWGNYVDDYSMQNLICSTLGGAANHDGVSHLSLHLWAADANVIIATNPLPELSHPDMAALASSFPTEEENNALSEFSRRSKNDGLRRSFKERADSPENAFAALTQLRQLAAMRA